LKIFISKKNKNYTCQKSKQKIDTKQTQVKKWDTKNSVQNFLHIRRLDKRNLSKKNAFQQFKSKIPPHKNFYMQNANTHLPAAFPTSFPKTDQCRPHVNKLGGTLRLHPCPL
jgi:hypothetical protein